MCTQIAHRVISCVLCLLLAQCGEVIQTTPYNPHEYVGQLDGALVSYAFTRTELSVTASYKSGILAIAAPTITPMPDLDHVHTLVYQHNALSIDAPDIMLEGVLLKQVSSTTTDQSTALVTAVNSLLTQAIATQTALIGTPTKPPAKAAPLGLVAGAPCPDDMQVSRVQDLTNNTSHDLVIQQGSQKCRIDLKITSGAPYRIFGFLGYPRADDVRPTEDYCNRAVCFRLTAGYKVTITASIKNRSTGDTVGDAQTITQQVIGAAPYDVGYVHFKRRPFTVNNTQISFTNGLVSEFKSSDPSEVVGFLALPTAALLTAAIIK